MSFHVKKGFDMGLYTNKDISITCPNCRKFLTKADKRDHTYTNLRVRIAENGYGLCPQVIIGKLKQYHQEQREAVRDFIRR